MIDSIIFASSNKGKIKEVRESFLPYNIRILSMEDVGFFDDIEETGSTFLENATIKAKAVHAKTGGIVLADDSGLEVKFLNNAPGIYSSRFAENDEKRINKLLGLLKGVPNKDREARFVCGMVVFMNDSQKIEVEGTVNGYITEKVSGENGFGYDPIFYVPEYNKTMAELSSDIKNKISHRARALNGVLEKLCIKELN